MPPPPSTTESRQSLSPTDAGGHTDGGSLKFEKVPPPLRSRVSQLFGDRSTGTAVSRADEKPIASTTPSKDQASADTLKATTNTAKPDVTPTHALKPSISADVIAMSKTNARERAYWG